MRKESGPKKELERIALENSMVPDKIYNFRRNRIKDYFIKILEYLKRYTK